MRIPSFLFSTQRVNSNPILWRRCGAENPQPLANGSLRTCRWDMDKIGKPVLMAGLSLVWRNWDNRFHSVPQIWLSVISTELRVRPASSRDNGNSRKPRTWIVIFCPPYTHLYQDILKPGNQGSSSSSASEFHKC